jgi:DNA-binding NarL/FixJ family response regulator
MDAWHGTTEAGETCVITVLLVDDQRAVRGVVRMQLELEPDMRIVGEAGTLAEALELAHRLRPDIVVIDVGLPDGDGVDAIPELTADGSKAVVLTMHDEAAVRERANQAGAAAFVAKFEPPGRLTEVLRSVAAKTDS